MTNFPNSIDTYVNPQPTDDEVLVPHATQHQNHNDSVIALETKVGANNSTVPTSHDFKLSEVATGDKAVSKTATQTLTNKTLTTPTINGGTSTSQTLTTPTVNVGADATGDLYARSSLNTLTRIPTGTVGQVLTSGGAGTVPAFQTPTTATAQQIQDQSFVYAATSTGTDSYAITLSPAPASYVIGQRFTFKADVANTGACSLNVNGLGARTIVKGISTGLSDGDISANQIVDVVYDGINFVLQNKVSSTFQDSPANPTATSSGTPVMMGLAGAIAPESSKVFIAISGVLISSSGIATSQLQIRYGTGTAPSNGSAASGTTAGTLTSVTSNATGGLRQSFILNAIITSLTPNTTYWLDVSMTASGGSMSIQDVNISAHTI